MKTTNILTIVNEAFDRERAEINRRLIKILQIPSKLDDDLNEIVFVLDEADQAFLASLHIRIGTWGFKQNVLRGPNDTTVWYNATTDQIQTTTRSFNHDSFGKLDVYNMLTSPDIMQRKINQGEPTRDQILQNQRTRERFANWRGYADDWREEVTHRIEKRTGFKAQVNTFGKHKIVKDR
jgi:hypothetical protein